MTNWVMNHYITFTILFWIAAAIIALMVVTIRNGRFKTGTYVPVDKITNPGMTQVTADWNANFPYDEQE